MKISVIVPCYQAERYIQRCLQSICSQTYSNLEIIVIDDGSTDASASIVKGLAQSDSRIKYIYQSNAGVSAARNAGLDYASGDVITFVDSDDTIKSHMYEILMDLMQKHHADISHCSYCRVLENGGIKNIGNTNQIYVFEFEEIALSFLEAQLVGPSCCNKLFKKSVVGTTRFQSQFKIGEDSLFAFTCFQKADRAVFIDSCFYTYFSAETSACVHTDLVKKREDLFRVNSLIYNESKGKGYEQLAFKRMNSGLLSLYRSYIYEKDEIYKQKAGSVRKQVIQAYDSRLYGGTEKKEAAIIKYIPFCFKPIYFVYNKIRTPNWDL